ncbi:MAG: hypothetical protein K2X81_10075, partial [Candidatus Obscuribacterales bacterium]|nr:hypothetical protein [Candidatus Obscuribacterales bacterium]
YWFDFRDSLEWGCISIRLKNVGIIACLMDGGCQKLTHADLMAPYERLTLHPYQFYELTALVFDKARRMTRNLSYSSFSGESAASKAVILQHGLNRDGPCFAPYDAEVYAKILAGIMFARIEDLYSPPNLVRSWLHDESHVNDTVFLDISVVPWPPEIGK